MRALTASLCCPTVERPINHKIQMILKYILLGITLLYSVDAQGFDCVRSQEANTCDEQLCLDVIKAREANSLSASLPWSLGLFATAREHVSMLQNDPPTGACGLNSWTEGPDNGRGRDEALWDECCINDETYVLEEAPGCQTDKPSQVTGAWDDKRYVGRGYSMAIDTAGTNVSAAVEAFKNNPKSQVLLFFTDWNAIGCRYKPPFAVVWFGDSAPKIDPYATGGELPILFEPTSNDSLWLPVGLGVAGCALLGVIAVIVFAMYQNGKIGNRAEKKEKKKKKDLGWDDGVELPDQTMGFDAPGMALGPPGMDMGMGGAPMQMDGGYGAQADFGGANGMYPGAAMGGYPNPDMGGYGGAAGGYGGGGGGVEMSPGYSGSPYAQQNGQWNAYY